MMLYRITSYNVCYTKLLRIVLQGLKIRGDIGGHLQFVGQEPHHADTQDPPHDLPDPDGRHAPGPGRRGQGIAKERVADHATRPDGENKPY